MEPSLPVVRSVEYMVRRVSIVESRLKMGGQG